MLTLAPATSPPLPNSFPTLTLSLAASNVPPHAVTVKSLAEARAKVLAYVRAHDIAASEYGSVTGRIDRDGRPFARVSFHGRLWALDEAGRETYREMNERGEVAP